MSLDPPTVRFAPVGAPPTRPPRPHLLRRVGRWIGGVLVVAVVAAAVAVAVVPAATGATALTVLSGSMEPALPVGSTVVVRPRPVSEIAVGDVITFTDRDKSGGTRVVTHRVIGVEPGPRFRTMGDANDAPDPGVVEAADVQGVQWYVVPWVGLIRDRLISPAGGFFAVGVLLLLTAAHVLLPATERTPPTDPRPEASGPHRTPDGTRGRRHRR
ncbi:MAG TPA: signal peptidase I [Pseudonocardia sp.]|nr:signal peptidase I [Pseudonocardia sp.]